MAHPRQPTVAEQVQQAMRAIDHASHRRQHAQAEARVEQARTVAMGRAAAEAMREPYREAAVEEMQEFFDGRHAAQQHEIRERARRWRADLMSRR